MSNVEYNINSLFVCNNGGVRDKERHDAELYYLKYIASQVSKLNLNDNEKEKEKEKEKENKNNNDDTDGVADKIESLFPRYKELVEKYGVQKERKVDSNTFSIVNVTLMTMDPKSITSESIVKKLPINMTVGQLKMLFKRHFKLSPKYQRLMMREKGSQEMPIDLGNDTSSLAFCGVKDGMQILMQSKEFDSDANEKKE